MGAVVVVGAVAVVVVGVVMVGCWSSCGSSGGC